MTTTVSRAVALCLVVSATNLFAEDPAKADKSQYTLFNPTPAAQMRGWRTDNAGVTPYTVDAGHYEAGLTPLRYAYCAKPSLVHYVRGMTPGGETVLLAMTRCDPNDY